DDAATTADQHKLDGLSWIWTADEGDATKSVPAGTRWFRNTITIDAGAKINKAEYLLTADNRFELTVNGKSVARGNDFHRTFGGEFTEHLKPGDNELLINVKNDKDGPAGLVGRLRVRVEGQPSRMIDIDESWQTAEDAAAPANEWSPAKAFAKLGDEPW